MTRNEEARELMRRLHQTRFATLPHYCRAVDNPGKEDVAEWRVWTQRKTTPDQVRIENHLRHLVTRDARILHVGIGNSSLARLMCPLVAQVEGITRYHEEADFAADLGISNYHVKTVNKYGEELLDHKPIFDFIIDNGANGFACCLFHFCRLMVHYRAMLRQGGVFLSAEPGLSWVADGDSGWAISWDDWVCLSRALGLRARRLDSFVYAMERPRSGERHSMCAMPILMYHSIAERGPAPLARYRVAPKAFAAQLKFLRQSGYQALSLDEWAACIARCEPPQGKRVIITFDDGYKDFLTGALPALLDTGFAATLFVVTGKVGLTADSDADENGALPLMDWDDLRHIRSHGVAVQSHCAKHANLLEMSDEAIDRDAREAQARLRAELGVEATMIAFPWGLSDARTRNALARSGYTIGLAASGGMSSLADDVMNLPRVEIYGDDQPEDFARKIVAAEHSVAPMPPADRRQAQSSLVGLAPDAAAALAERTAVLLDEIVSLRAAVARALVPPGTVAKRLGGLFALPVTPAPVAVAPYRPLCAGIWLGFQRTAQVSLAVRQRDAGDGEASHAVIFAFSGNSTFFTVEAQTSWAELSGCEGFRLAAVVEPSRPVSGHAVLRLPTVNGGARDFEFLRFDLLPGRRLVELAGELRFGDLRDTDQARDPLLLIFFDSAVPLTLDVDDLTFDFLK
jgi:peptidoglycan/xylan/chitin deacetylase (PgdA/CDA1 family)